MWLEYSERFGIDFAVHKDRIAFVELMNDVRNQIVHDGGEAQTFKFLCEFDWNDANPQYMDTSFAEKYPDYVSEDGSEVNVSEQQLKDAIDASVRLVEVAGCGTADAGTGTHQKWDAVAMHLRDMQEPRSPAVRLLLCDGETITKLSLRGPKTP